MQFQNDPIFCSKQRPFSPRVSSIALRAIQMEWRNQQEKIRPSPISSDTFCPLMIFCDSVRNGHARILFDLFGFWIDHSRFDLLLVVSARRIEFFRIKKCKQVTVVMWRKSTWARTKSSFSRSVCKKKWENKVKFRRMQTTKTKNAKQKKIGIMHVYVTNYFDNNYVRRRRLNNDWSFKIIGQFWIFTYATRTANAMNMKFLCKMERAFNVLQKCRMITKTPVNIHTCEQRLFAMENLRTFALKQIAKYQWNCECARNEHSK